MRSILKAAAVAGAAASLALAAASAAGASTTGGSPSPKGTPPPVVRHHKPEVRTFCFYSLETETDGLNGQPASQDHGQQAPNPKPTQTIVDGPQGQPTGAPTGQPQGDQVKGTTEIEVVQLVKVCETIRLDRGDHHQRGDNWGDSRGDRGEVIAVTATDVSGPFAWTFNADQGPADHAPAGFGALLAH